jgi:hypothetical protein
MVMGDLCGVGRAICEKPKPGPHRSGNRVVVLDLYQIKGGRLCLYLLLDLDDEVCKSD